MRLIVALWWNSRTTLTHINGPLLLMHKHAERLRGAHSSRQAVRSDLLRINRLRGWTEARALEREGR